MVRRDGRNRYYLDLYWPEWKLVVEIDGIHHAWAENVVGDALRQKALALDGDTVLRLPLLGYRLAPDEFFGQIAQALDRDPLDVIRTEQAGALSA
jgi:very-short-patch-repair endonuclease